MRGEVGLLSRNVFIQGDVGSQSGNSANEGWGGHVMVVKGGQLRIEAAELYHMGQAGELGRYPIHFHVAGIQVSFFLSFLIFFFFPF